MDTNLLGRLELPDHNGKQVRLGDLWADQTVILVFLRHFG